MSDVAAREALKTWMRAVIAANGWTAEEWARKAQTSGTNITRFMRDAHDFMPSTRTILALAAAAGVAPPMQKMGSPKYTIVPLIPHPQIETLLARKLTVEAWLNKQLNARERTDIATPGRAPENSFAIEITGGQYAKQLAVVEPVPAEKLSPGNKVVVIARTTHDTVIYAVTDRGFFDLGTDPATAFPPTESYSYLGRLVSLTQYF